jgi:putative two-component system response regulator
MLIASGSAAKSVTLVDDERQALEPLIDAATSLQYRCQAAAHAEHALELLERNPTSIVVVDLDLPGGGVWLVREIRRRWPKTITIVTTAEPNGRSVLECLDAGASRCFVKPLKLADFQSALESGLREFQEKSDHALYHRELRQTVRRQTRRLRRTFFSAIDSLCRTLEARDPYTSGHSLRVRQYSLRLAAALNLRHRERKQLSLASRLHDIGKVGIPEAILNKPGPLTAKEFRLVQEHPLISERILAPFIRDPIVLATVRGHHERFDGQGYPDRLVGEQIPPLARLIAVTDSFDALTSSRSYRAGLSFEQALEIVRAGAGSQFDPVMALAFIRVAEQDLPPPAAEEAVPDVIAGAWLDPGSFNSLSRD